jgi:hypothetical protein
MQGRAGVWRWATELLMSAYVSACQHVSAHVSTQGSILTAVWMHRRAEDGQQRLFPCQRMSAHVSTQGNIAFETLLVGKRTALPHRFKHPESCTCSRVSRDLQTATHDARPSIAGGGPASACSCGVCASSVTAVCCQPIEGMLLPLQVVVLEARCMLCAPYAGACCVFHVSLLHAAGLSRGRCLVLEARAGTAKAEIRWPRHGLEST